MTHDAVLELQKLLSEIKTVIKPKTANKMAIVRVERALKRVLEGFDDHVDSFKSKLTEVINDTKKESINTRSKQKNVCCHPWEVGVKQAAPKRRKKNGAKL